MATPGRKPFKPTPADIKLVSTLAAFGIPEDEIAGQITNPSTGKAIAPKTLRKWFKHELTTAHTKANARVAEALFNKAIGSGMGSVTAAIFWLKTRAGWKETQTLEHTGPGGGPVVSVSMETADPVEASKAYLDFVGR